MEIIHLQGAEQVERAASRMEAAAEKMKEAAREMDYTLGNHQRFLSDWLERFQGSLHDLMEVLPNPDEPIKVRVVAGEEEDSHEAKTVPAPADHGPIELEGAAS
jgi:hypothetical protein